MDFSFDGLLAFPFIPQCKQTAVMELSRQQLLIPFEGCELCLRERETAIFPCHPFHPSASVLTTQSLATLHGLRMTICAMIDTLYLYHHISTSIRLSLERK